MKNVACVVVLCAVVAASLAAAPARAASPPTVDKILSKYVAARGDCRRFDPSIASAKGARDGGPRTRKGT